MYDFSNAQELHDPLYLSYCSYSEIMLHLQKTEDKAPDGWDDRSELCSLKVFLLHTFILSLDSADFGESYRLMTKKFSADFWS